MEWKIGWSWSWKKKISYSGGGGGGKYEGVVGEDGREEEEDKFDMLPWLRGCSKKTWEYRKDLPSKNSTSSRIRTIFCSTISLGLKGKGIKSSGNIRNP